jgi:hypothetical protein
MQYSSLTREYSTVPHKIIAVLTSETRQLLTRNDCAWNAYVVKFRCSWHYFGVHHLLGPSDAHHTYRQRTLYIRTRNKRHVARFLQKKIKERLHIELR